MILMRSQIALISLVLANCTADPHTQSTDPSSANSDTSPATSDSEATTTPGTSDTSADACDQGPDGEIVVLAANVPAPTRIALDATHVWWVGQPGYLMKCAKDGCADAPTTILTDQPGPLDLIVDSGKVY